MSYSNKKKSGNLVHDFPISTTSFMYIIGKRYNSKEPLYVTLDRILQQHKRLTSKKKEVIQDNAEETITCSIIGDGMV
jgi:hypothetical protein